MIWYGLHILLGSTTNIFKSWFGFSSIWHEIHFALWMPWNWKANPTYKPVFLTDTVETLKPRANTCLSIVQNTHIQYKTCYINLNTVLLHCTNFVYMDIFVSCYILHCLHQRNGLAVHEAVDCMMTITILLRYFTKWRYIDFLIMSIGGST